MSPISAVEDLALVQSGVVTAPQCYARGITRNQIRMLCRTGRWQRLHRAVYYVYGSSEVSARAALVAAVLSAGPEAVAVLETAAMVHGIAGARRTGRIHLSLPAAGARSRRFTDETMCLHQFVLRPHETTVIDGISVTTAVRTVADLMLASDRLTAVSVLDSALYGGILSSEDLPRLDASMYGRRGAAAARSWIAEADKRAESPLETRVRLRAVDGGVGPEVLQYPVYTRTGAVAGITDLAWPSRGVIGEADGKEVHDQPSALFRDRTRQNLIVAAGFLPVRFTWEDTLDRDTVPRAVREAFRRAAVLRS